MNQNQDIEKRFTPQYTPSLVYQITEFLTREIIQGRLVGGEQLVENEFQRKFGISRSPIREAFRILEQNGLITVIPRKGSFVRKITKKDVEENFIVRAYLEGLAARTAILHFDSARREKMELALSNMTEELKKNNVKSYLEYHSDFHETFIYASENDALIKILETLRRQAIWFRFSYLAVTYVQEFQEYVTRTHREILDFLLEKNANQVESLVKDHILVALKRFLEFSELKI